MDQSQEKKNGCWFFMTLLDIPQYSAQTIEIRPCVYRLAINLPIIDEESAKAGKAQPCRMSTGRLKFISGVCSVEPWHKGSLSRSLPL
jgi:hypothetical protein